MPTTSVKAPNLEENVVIEIVNPNQTDESNKNTVHEYFNPETSYFKQYDMEIYDLVNNIYETNLILLVNLINTEVKQVENEVLQFLYTQNIGNLDRVASRYKLNRILKQYPIPSIPNKLDNPLKDIKMALIIEKFYQITGEKGEGSCDSISLSEILDEITDITCDTCPSLNPNNDNNSNNPTNPNDPNKPNNPNNPKRSCPSFPPNFQKPVFNPCEYPHVLKLYSHFYEHCYDYRNLHGLAGAYYNNMSKKFTAPTLVLSAFSSIASFVASSEIIANKWKVALTLSVGIMTTLTAMIQAFSSAYQFDLKSSSHFKASDNYDQLITEIDFEKSYPSDTDFFQNLEKKVLEVKSNCQFIVPNYIKSEYYRSKEKANERDFINKNIIKPMETDLREAIVGGNMNNYKFADQGEHIRQELVKLRNLKMMFLEEEQLRKKCCHKGSTPKEIGASSAHLKNENNQSRKKCCCCLSTRCNNIDEEMIRHNSINV